MKFLKHLPFLLIISLNLYGQPEEFKGGISIEKLKQYERFIIDEIENSRIPGAITMIMRNGEIVLNKAYGYSNIDQRKLMQTDDIFSIMSMTKCITSVAIMMLYEEGKFQLNDPVSMYLPSFKGLKVINEEGETEELENEVTILNLLTHTSGIGNQGHAAVGDEISRILLHPYPDIASRVSAYMKLPLIYQPGERWYYSVSPDVLSVLIEKFSGMSTNNFLKERLFEPLKMNDTGYNVPKEHQSRIVQLHELKGDSSLIIVPYPNTVAGNMNKIEGNTTWSGKVGLYTTVSDYMKFCQMMLNGGEINSQRILSRETIELMTENQVGNLFNFLPGRGFGLGFAVIKDLAARKNLGSKGLYYFGGGFNTLFFIDPKENLVVIFMTQTFPSNILYYHNKMRELIFPAIVN